MFRFLDLEKPSQAGRYFSSGPEPYDSEFFYTHMYDSHDTIGREGGACDACNERHLVDHRDINRTCRSSNAAHEKGIRMTE